jgi:Ca2+-binding RTX toxin-like protein
MSTAIRWDLDTVTQGAKGRVTVNADGTVTYTPFQAEVDSLAAGETATDEFTFTITDGTEFVAQTVTVTVTGENDAPVAGDDNYSARGSQVLTVNAALGVLDNDSDVDTGASLVVQAGTLTTAQGATVVLAADGSFTYDATAVPALNGLAAGSSVADSFTYTVVDDLGATTTATVSLTVSGDTIIVNGVASVVLESGFQDIILGSDGDDAVTLSGQAEAGDRFDGGAGTDTLTLTGRPQVDEISLSGTVAAGDIFTLSVDSDTYTYTAIAGDGLAEVAFGLVSALNADTGSDVSGAITLADDTVFTLTADVGGVPFTSGLTHDDGANVSDLAGLISTSQTVAGNTITVRNTETVIGGDQADAITGSADGVEVIQGGGGDDVLDGGGGVTFLRGGVGNDTLSGGGDGSGADVTVADYSDQTDGVTATLGSTSTATGTGIGTDTLNQVDVVVGGAGNDVLSVDGDYVNQFQDAGSGVNSRVEFEGGAGDDTITGNGNTGVSYANAADGVRVDLQAGTAASRDIPSADNPSPVDSADIGDDTLSGISDVRGSDFDDELLGSDNTAPGSVEFFDGGAGNDIIDGRGGIDVVDYSSSTQGLNVNLSGGQVDDGLGGTDTLSNIEGIAGSFFDDDILGSSGDDIVFGQGGDDSIEGGAGDDVIEGGAGNDYLFAGDGNDAVNGGAGDDTIIGGSGNGDDAYAGGTGADTLVYSSATSGITVDLDAGSATGVDIGTDTIADDIETVVAGQGDDMVLGSTRDENLFGGTGDDTLSSGGGNDLLDGGAGNDVLEAFGTDITNGDQLKLGDAFATAGSGGIDVPNVSVASASAFTLEALVYFDDPSDFPDAFSTIMEFGENGPALGVSSGGTLELRDATGERFGGTVAVQTWTHVAAVFDGADTTLYLDGVEVLSQAFAPTKTGVGLSIGEGTASGNGNWTGLIDDVRVWTTARTADQILDNIDNHLQGDEAGLIGYWPMETNLAGRVVDQSVNSFNGALTGDGAITRAQAPGATEMRGGDGDDTFTFSAPEGRALGDIDIVGGAGNDVLDLSTLDGPFFIDLLNGEIYGDELAGAFSIDGIERIIGTAGDDIYIGTDNADDFQGAGGDDLILAGGGDDLIDGGAGNDIIDGGAGNDTLSGADGEDGISGGLGDDSIDGGAGNDLIDGEAGADSILGGLGDDTVAGGAGDDIIDGGDGLDQIDGGLGDDTLTGGLGDDALVGGLGGDVIMGGDGADQLGGDSNVTFTEREAALGGQVSTVAIGGTVEQGDQFTVTIDSVPTVITVTTEATLDDIAQTMAVAINGSASGSTVTATATTGGQIEIQANAPGGTFTIGESAADATRADDADVAVVNTQPAQSAQQGIVDITISGDVLNQTFSTLVTGTNAGASSYTAPSTSSFSDIANDIANALSTDIGGISATVQGVTQEYTGSASFDGSGGEVGLQRSISSALGTQVTLEAWIKPVSGSGSYAIIGFGAGNGDPGDQSTGLILSDGLLKFAPTDTFYSPAIDGKSGVVIGEWNHVAVTYDSGTGTIRYLVNGSFAGSQALSPATAISNATAFSIGNQDALASDGINSVNPFNGQIAEVRVWDGIRSDSDIANSYQTSTPTGASGGTQVFGETLSGDTDAPIVQGDQATIRITGADAAEVTMNGGAATINESPVQSAAAGQAQLDVVTVTAPTIEVGDTYRVTINGKNFDHVVASESETVGSITTALVAAINAGVQPVTAVPLSGNSFSVLGDSDGVSFSIAGSDINAATVDYQTISTTTVTGDDVTQIEAVLLDEDTLAPGATYTLHVNDITLTYTADGTESGIADVRDDLLAQIQADSTLSAILSAEADPNLDGKLTLTGLSGGDSFDTFLGRSGAWAATTSIYGGAGDDDILGGIGDDVLIGEAGADTYYHAIGHGFDTVTVQTGEGRLDTVDLGPAYELNWNWDGDDLLIAGENADFDYDFADTGYVRIVDHFAGTGDGLNYFEADLSLDTSYDANGWYSDHTVQGQEDAIARVYTQTGVNGEDQGGYTELVRGTTGDDVIHGGAGVGDGTSDGGGTGGFRDYLYGWDGNDVIHGADDTMDTLRGGSGDDTLYGYGGDDRFFGDAGDDTMDGGAGTDMARYDRSSDGVTVDLGKQGGAFPVSARFDGGNDEGFSLSYGGAPVPAALQASPDLTLEMWIDPENGMEVQDLLHAQTDSGDVLYSLRYDQGDIVFSHGVSGVPLQTFEVVFDAGLALNEARHIALVRNSTDLTVRLYVDGEEIEPASVTDAGMQLNLSPGDPAEYTAPPAATDGSGGGLFVAANYDNAAFTGRLADLRVWHTARTQADVQADAEGYVDPTTTGLAANWRFDDAASGAATTAVDATGGPGLFGAATWDNSGLGVAQRQFVSASQGTDTLVNIEDVRGSNFDDDLYGDDGDNYLDGRDGDDIIEGRDGDDLLRGRDGDDDLIGGAGNDTLRGDAGVDWLDGGAGNDVLRTGSGDDVIFASEGIDYALTEGGADTFTVGIEPLEFSYTSLRLVSAERGVVSEGAGADDLVFTLVDEQGNQHFTSFGDHFAGSALANLVVDDPLISAGFGMRADLLAAATGDAYAGTIGDDTIDGGAGNDLIFGGRGADALLGGDGDDILDYDALDTLIAGGAGTDTLMVNGGDVTLGDAITNQGLAEIERILLSDPTSGQQDVRFTAEDVLALTTNATLRIDGDTGARAVATDAAAVAWSSATQSTIDGETYNVYTADVNGTTVTVEVHEDVAAAGFDNAAPVADAVTATGNEEVAGCH